MTADKRRRGEFDLIRDCFRPLAAKEGGALNLLDDAALLKVQPGYSMAVTTDTLIAGVHFLSTDTPADVAHKGLAVNVSDLAAMGAEPRWYFLNLSVNTDLDDGWLNDFAAGLAAAQETMGVVLAGGDTTRTPGPLTLSITAIGDVPLAEGLVRGGARAGERVWVSGCIGDGYLGLLAAEGRLDGIDGLDGNAVLQRYRRPEPRVALGLALRGRAGGVVDVSDGLLADLGHIAEASRIGLRIDAAKVPLSETGKAWVGDAEDRLSEVLAGGDDYELAFTMPDSGTPWVEALSRNLDLPLTCIGTVEADPEPPVLCLGSKGSPLAVARSGFQHF